MATYGRGQMLGAGVDPRMFTQDFSGFANAGMIQGQAMAGLGQNIARGIEGFQEKKKEQAGIERQIKKADNVAKAIADMIPDLAPTIDEARMQLSDMNLPQNDRLAIAEGISDILNIGIAEVRGRQDRAFREREFQAKYAPPLPQMPKPVGAPFWVPEGDTETQYQRMDDGSIVPVADLIRNASDWGMPQGDAMPSSAFIDSIDSGAFAQEGDLDPMAISDAMTGFDGGPGVLPELPARSGVGTRPIQQRDDKGTWEQNVEAGGRIGQRNTKTGEFKAYPQQGGRITRFNKETGELEIIEGAQANQDKRTQREIDAELRAIGLASGLVVRDTQQIIPMIEKTTPWQRKFAEGEGSGIRQTALAGTDAYNTSKLIESIKASVAIDSLINLRATGTTLGQVPQKQLDMLSDLLGSLDVGLSNDILVSKVNDIYTIYGEILKGIVNRADDNEKKLFSPILKELESFRKRRSQDSNQGARAQEPIDSNLSTYEQEMERLRRLREQ